MKYRLVDRMKYIVRVCRICHREFATHPVTYRAKVDKGICLDCFIKTEGENE